jgi:hypothetical protein
VLASTRITQYHYNTQVVMMDIFKMLQRILWMTASQEVLPGLLVLLTLKKIIGVFNGAFYIDSSTSKPTYANSVTSGTTFGTNYNTGSSDGIGYVNDNPMQEYTCKADAAVNQVKLLYTFNSTDGATSGTSYQGQSTVKLNITGTVATSMFRIVRFANDPEKQ